MKIAGRTAGVLALSVIVAACAPAGTTTLDSEYTVDIDPAAFVAVVDNPFFPLVPGSVYEYEAATPEGVEVTTVEVLDETRQVMGIAATVVHDTVTLHGALVEDTFDWYAQDQDGNVWYLGEDVSNYEDGRLRDHAGSWEAGVDGALPGILMLNDPAEHIGETYRQEYARGEAEDMGQVLSVTESVSVPYGTFRDAVMTLDTSPLDPGVREQKYYAQGIGLVWTMNPDTGEQEVLTSFSPP